MSIVNSKMVPYVKSVGTFNELPSPMVECPIGEFWFAFMSQNWVHEEFRQCYFTPEDKKKFRIHSCRIFWFHDQGYLLLPIGSVVYTKGKPHQYAGMTCYRIGCDHEYTHTSPRMCEHVYTCTKCGYSYSVDSSD